MNGLIKAGQWALFWGFIALIAFAATGHIHP